MAISRLLELSVLVVRLILCYLKKRNFKMIYMKIVDDKNAELLRTKLEEQSVRPLGTIRLWIKSNPPIRTKKAIVITEETLLGVGENAKSVDMSDINQEITRVFNHSGVAYADYEAKTKRNFCCDILLSKEIIDGYTG